MPHVDEGTIHGWLDGALGVDEAARVEAHVAGCAACAAAVAEARGLVAASSRIVSALDNVPRAVIPGANVPAASRAGAGGGWEPVRPWATRLRVAAVVAFVAAGAVVVAGREDWRGARAAIDEVAPSAAPSAAPSNAASAAASAAAVTEPIPLGDTRRAADGGDTVASRSASGSSSVSAARQDVPRTAARTGTLSAAAVARAPASPASPPLYAADSSRLVAGVFARARDQAKAAAETGTGAVPPAVAQLTTTPGLRARVTSPEAAEATRRRRAIADPGRLEPQALLEQLAEPPERQIEGLRLIGTAVQRTPTRVSRLSTYEVRPGVIVTLEEAVPFAAATADSLARDREARESARRGEAGVSGAAALRAETDRAEVRAVYWVSSEGNELTLSGPMTPLELEALRARVR